MTIAPTMIGPNGYASWRATSLGAVSEALEQRLMLELMGSLEGAHILHVGCGDGAQATGFDPDPAMLAAARTRADKNGITAAFSRRAQRAASLSRCCLRRGGLDHRSVLCPRRVRRSARDGACASAGRASCPRRARAMEPLGYYSSRARLARLSDLKSNALPHRQRAAHRR